MVSTWWTKTTHSWCCGWWWRLLRCPTADSAAEDKAMTWVTPRQRMDKSGQGPKRAIAGHIAHLLEVQPSICSTEDSSSRRPIARVLQLSKLRPPLRARRFQVPLGKEDAIVPGWLMEGCWRQRRGILQPWKVYTDPSTTLTAVKLHRILP
jgi:hypothetical protein